MESNLSYLVTGGTGTFGQAFVPYLLEHANPKRVAIYSRGWEKQEQARQKLNDGRVRYFIGDVASPDRLFHAMRDIDVVVHAAAFKHVPLGEYNPLALLMTNIIGSWNVIDMAIRSEVSKVLAISTDKAAAPVNAYGISKAFMESLIIQSNNYAASTKTRLSCVRYGNVLGASGSVLEIWANKYPLPITDMRMTRFIMTVEQACAFVIQALTEMVGGEIFVPKLPACHITDLAYTLYPARDMVEVGVRPGEKIHEVLVTRDEARRTHDQEWAYVIEPAIREWETRILEGAIMTGEFRSDTAEQLSPREILRIIE